MKLNLKEIVQIPFSEDQYFKEAQKKTQIVLHHSAGWDNARNMFAGFMADKTRVATCMGVSDDGTIYQIFGSQYWAYHVNILSKGNSKVYLDSKFKKYCSRVNAVDVEKRTIGVEICSWGGLTEKNGKFISWAGAEVKKEKVIVYEKPFRGYNSFEKYTNEEIDACYKLIKYWSDRYNIPVKFDYKQTFEISEKALKGDPGLYGHASYRIDKNDVHPQPELIEMLKAL